MLHLSGRNANIYFTRAIFLSIVILNSGKIVNSQVKDTFNYTQIKGLYETSDGKHYIINPGKEFQMISCIETGDAHILRLKTAREFEISITRSSWAAIGGYLSFKRKPGSFSSFTLKINSPYNEISGKRINLPTEDYLLKINDSVTIGGELIEPVVMNSNPIAVLLHGDGDNDRYDAYDLAIYLVYQGIPVFIFDKRNVGKSTGPKIRGNTYDKISRQYATDAIDIVKALKQEPACKNRKIGIAGISQGGWIGSMVSAKINDLAFYINIAGNASEGWKQYRHWLISYVKHSGFTEKEAAEAADYYDAYFNAQFGKLKLGSYQSKLEQYKETAWFKAITKRRGFIGWKDQHELDSVIALPPQPLPLEDFKKVLAPTLGIFFQYDNSNPPETPKDFIDGMLQSKTNNITVRVFENANHGMWEVPSYYFKSEEIKRRSPVIFKFISDWILNL